MTTFFSYDIEFTHKMSDLKTYRNRHGSLTMGIEGRILFAQFSGSVSTGVMSFFYESLIELAHDLKGEPWAFLNASEEAFAATADAEKLLVQAGVKGYELGCVQAAYVLKSPVAVAQAKKIREQLNNPQPLEDVLFANADEAKDYLISYLAKYPSVQP